MPLIGQRLSSSSPQYIKIPPNTACWLNDGMTLDAGTAMIYENNINHCLTENLRELVHAIGHNGQEAIPKTTFGWETADIEGAPSDPSTEPLHRQIAWTRKCSVRWGPYFIPADRPLGDGNYTIRKVKCHLGYSNASGIADSIFYVALTPDADPPRNGILPGCIETHTDGASGDGATELTISCTGLPPAPMRLYAGREAISVQQVYVWLGFSLNADTSDWTYFDAYEIR